MELSTMVWFDDELDTWVYSILNAQDSDEMIIAWGEEESREDACISAVRELTTYINGV